MITRRHRFHGYGSLKATYSGGQSVRSGPLTLRYLERPLGKPYRVAVVVSRKVNKSAVVRNRIRRRLYEVVRSHESIVPAGTDLIFTVFGDQLADMETASLETLVVDLLQKAARN